MVNPGRELDWSSWMRSATAGNPRAYLMLLTAITPALRVMAQKRCDILGVQSSEAEGLVQELLLAIHQKRGSWDPSRPLWPWLSALVHHKLADDLRRYGHRMNISLEDVEVVLASHERLTAIDQSEAVQGLSRLKDLQRTIVQSISVEGTSVRETAIRLNVRDVAAQVWLHRALKALAAFYAKRVA